MAGPLKGLKIIDFSTLLPGPYATMALADLGADVLRIVSGSRPDLTDFMPPILPNTKISANGAWMGRGKRSVTLNLKDKRAIKIVHQLLADYDIIVEQFRPGVMERLGLGYSDLKKVNPAIIYGSLTGYGQTGPLSKKAGHDINYISRSGLMSYSGRNDTGPSLTGMQIADVASGSNNMIIGILSAVYYRSNTGKGQYLDISMMDGVVAFNAMTGAAFLAGGDEPLRESEFLNGGCLYDFYQTEDNKYLSFGGLEPKFFSAFCKAIGCDDLIEGGVNPEGLQDIKKRVREIIRQKRLDDWMKIFDQVDACVEPVFTLEEAFRDPHIMERGLIIDVEIPGGGTVKQIANPIKFSETQPEYNTTGQLAGTHTKDVLKSLGYSENDVEEFEKTGLFS
ncbi:MAG: CoA transferase [Desulfosarcina sp.]|nr:CoA transferase [Desulfobacterales bacterium]